MSINCVRDTCCYCFNFHGDASQSHLGKCRAHPPGEDGFPTVRASEDWCSEFNNSGSSKLVQIIPNTHGGGITAEYSCDPPGPPILCPVVCWGLRADGTIIGLSADSGGLSPVDDTSNFVRYNFPASMAGR